MSGLIPTTIIAIENVTCPDNATSASNCSVVSPPVSPRCFSGIGAAGVRCIQS